MDSIWIPAVSGHIHISYITNGRVYKSDEKAEEEEEVFERNDNFRLKMNINKKIYMNK